MGRSRLLIKAVLIAGCLGVLLWTGCEGKDTADATIEIKEAESEVMEAEVLTIYPTIPNKKGMIISDFDRWQVIAPDNGDEQSDTRSTEESVPEDEGESISPGEADPLPEEEVIEPESADEGDVGTDSGYVEPDIPAEDGDVSDEADSSDAVPVYRESVMDGYNDATPESGTDISGVDESGYVESGESLTSLGEWTLSFYCPCSICCGSYATGYTASGTLAQPWHTCATDGLDFGTTLYVDGYGYFVVEDRGTSYGWLDIFVGDHNEALSLGLKTAEVYLVG